MKYVDSYATPGRSGEIYFENNLNLLRSGCFIGRHWIGYQTGITSADSEIRTHDGALQNDFPEQNWSWEDSGTIISET